MRISDSGCNRTVWFLPAQPFSCGPRQGEQNPTQTPSPDTIKPLFHQAHRSVSPSAPHPGSPLDQSLPSGWTTPDCLPGDMGDFQPCARRRLWSHGTLMWWLLATEVPPKPSRMVFPGRAAVGSKLTVEGLAPSGWLHAGCSCRWDQSSSHLHTAPDP